MGLCYDITDKFPEWNEFDPANFDDHPLFEATEYPELDDARRAAARDHPRGAHALMEVAVNLGTPDQFIGRDPTEMRLDVSEEEFLNEFARYKWVAASQLSRLSMAMATNMMEVLQTWDDSKLEEFYDDFTTRTAHTAGQYDTFDEFRTMVHGFQPTDGMGHLNSAFGRMVYEPTIPNQGEHWVITAPHIPQIIADDRPRVGAIDLDDASFQDMYRKSYIAQDATVQGFTPWWNNGDIDRGMSALAHPRMRVKLNESGHQLIVGPQDVIGPCDEFEPPLPSIDDRKSRLYPNGILPKNGDVWVTSLPDNYESYADGILPEEDLGRGGTTMRAVIRKNVDWYDIVTENPVEMDGVDADALYHPWMAVELDDGTSLTLPPAAFVSQVE